MNESPAVNAITQAVVLSQRHTRDAYHSARWWQFRKKRRLTRVYEANEALILGLNEQLAIEVVRGE